MFSSSVSLPSFAVQPVAEDGLVNGGGAHSSTFVAHVDLHQPPDATEQASVLDEPEPDYDSKDEDNEGHVPPQTEVVSAGPPPPTPPPLPPPSSLGFTAGLRVQAAAEKADPAEVVAARKRDEAHAALLAAVQRRRHLLDSVDGELIADSIENRVQRAKMLQTVYRADQGAGQGQSDQSEHQPVGLLGVADPPNGNFTSEAERARLEYVRRLQQQQQSKQPPPTKPVRTVPPTAPKSTLNGGVVRVPPPPPPRSVIVNESHNRALAEYVNGSSKVYTAATAVGTATPGDVDRTAGSFVRLLDDPGESTTEPSPTTPATANDRRLRVVTDDTASVLSSLSTISTNSSVGVGGVGPGDGTVSLHGSPSHSSSGDSGFAKSSVTGGGGAVVADQPIIPPPTEFASPSDHSSSSSSSTSVQTTIPALRSVAKQQSHSMIFPARTQVTQK